MDTRQPRQPQGKPAADAVENWMKIAVRDIGIPPRPTILAQIRRKPPRTTTWTSSYLGCCSAMMTEPSAGMIKVANSPLLSFGKSAEHPGSPARARPQAGHQHRRRAVAAAAFKHVPNMERFWDASAATAEISAMLVKQIGNGIGIFARKTPIPSPCFRDCGIPMLMIPFRNTATS